MKHVRVYSREMDRSLPPYMSLVGLVAGGVFLVWYGLEIRSAITSDLHNLSASFRSSPVLTVAFATLKLFGYVWFPYIAATWVYVPLRNYLGKRVYGGRLLEVVNITSQGCRIWWTRVPLLSWFLSWGMPVPGMSPTKRIHLGERVFCIPDAPSLSQVLSNQNVVGHETRFSFGAFNRVLSIELVRPDDNGNTESVSGG